MASIISSNNKKKITENLISDNISKECSCTRGNVCPVEGKCLQKEVIYQAKVSTASESQFYIGLTEKTFKNQHLHMEIEDNKHSI